MSDRFPTEVEIGGPLTKAQLRQIAELAGQCSLSCNWEQNYDPDWIEKRLMAQLEADEQFLELNDHDISHEYEQELTDYLIEQGIPWNKRVTARYEYDADLTWWRPGMKRPEQWCMMDHDCNSVQVSLELLKKWRKQRKGLDWAIKQLEKVAPKMVEVILTD